MKKYFVNNSMVDDLSFYTCLNEAISDSVGKDHKFITSGKTCVDHVFDGKVDKIYAKTIDKLSSGLEVILDNITFKFGV